MSESRDSGAARFALPALLLANMVIACGPMLVRIAASDGGIGPVASGFWRLSLALPVLLVMARAKDGVPPLPPGKATAIIALSGVAFAADLGFWHVGILHTRLANAALLGNVTALLFPLYGFVVARTWPHARQWTALGLAAGGTMLLLGRSYELSREHLLGDLSCILAGASYTAYLILLDRVKGATGPFATFAVSMAVSAPVLLAFAWGLGEPIWPHVWWPLIALAAGSQLFGQGLILHAVSRVPPLMVGLSLLVQPIISTMTGWIFYGEALGRGDMAGALLVALAVLLVRDRRREALPEERRPLSSVP